MEWSSLFMVVIENNSDSFLLAKLSMVNAFLTPTTPSAATRTDIKLTRPNPLPRLESTPDRVPASRWSKKQRHIALSKSQLRVDGQWFMLYVATNAVFLVQSFFKRFLS